MIKILFVCHGNISKSPEKASKINGFTMEEGAYYTTTTPFLKEPWMTISSEQSNDVIKIIALCL